MAMDTKDETLEAVSAAEEIKPDKNIKDVIEQKTSVVEDAKSEPVIQASSSNLNKKEVKQTIDSLIDIEDVSDDKDDAVKESNKEEVVVTPKKRKAPLIILLSILLVIDVAALVVYIIGVDKILSFIK